MLRVELMGRCQSWSHIERVPHSIAIQQSTNTKPVIVATLSFVCVPTLLPYTYKAVCQHRCRIFISLPVVFLHCCVSTPLCSNTNVNCCVPTPLCFNTDTAVFVVTSLPPCNICRYLCSGHWLPACTGLYTTLYKSLNGVCTWIPKSVLCRTFTGSLLDLYTMCSRCL